MNKTFESAVKEMREIGKSKASDHRAKAGLLLRAIRDFRYRIETTVHGGVTSHRLGFKGTSELLRGVIRLRYISPLKIGAQNEDVAVLMLDAVEPYSKAAAVVAMLEAHGMPSNQVWCPGRVGPLRRLGLKLMALRVALSLRPWKRRLKMRDLLLIVASFTHARRLIGGKAATVHIGDRSPRRIALATGAALASRKSIYWQVEYSELTISDLGFTDAAVLNSGGEAAFAGRTTRLWALPAIKSLELRLPEYIDRLGVATNAFAGREFEAMRVRIDTTFPNASVALRLHPRVEKFDNNMMSGWDVRPRGESLEAFARSCDVVVCGNTAAQIEILRFGTPVLHLAGLDPHGFDLYGYVARDITYGFTTPPDERIEDALTAFYNRPGWSSRLDSVVSEVSDGTPCLRQYVEAVLR